MNRFILIGGCQEKADLSALSKAIFADGNSAYDQITDSWVIVSKKFTQKIEKKHLSLRTWCSRLVRKGIRFSKSFLPTKLGKSTR